jgi:hypothetical integral membrane protein (TIGR02206 family)
MPPRFEAFGPAHLIALAATAITAAVLSLLVRRGPDGRPARALRFGVAVLLLGQTAVQLFAAGRERGLTAWDLVPLQLCDFAILLAAFALLTLNPLACELLYFWACTGTLLAMVTPDLWYGFPDWRFLGFFGLHGAVVVSALVLVFGYRQQPRPGAPWRAFLLTNLYAAVVGAVNLAFGTNFLFLREKPQAPTLLDWFGPWPAYLLACEALALCLFLLLDLPFRLARRRRA